MLKTSCYKFTTLSGH